MKSLLEIVTRHFKYNNISPVIGFEQVNLWLVQVNGELDLLKVEGFALYKK